MQTLGAVTLRFVVVNFWPILPTLGEVKSTEGFCELWKLSCISVHSSLPVSAYMWNILTWSARDLVSQHLKWQTGPGRGHNSTIFCEEDIQGNAFSFLYCFERSASLDVLLWSGAGYSAGWLPSIGRSASLSQCKIWESYKLWSGHSCYPCLHMALLSSVTPNTIANHASYYPRSVRTPKTPDELSSSIMVFSFTCSFFVQLEWIRFAVSFGIGTCGFALASFNLNHLLIIQGFTMCSIQCTAFCSAVWSSVWIAWIKLFIVEYNASTPWYSITVSSSRFSSTSSVSNECG